MSNLKKRLNKTAGANDIKCTGMSWSSTDDEFYFTFDKSLKNYEIDNEDCKFKGAVWNKIHEEIKKELQKVWNENNATTEQLISSMLEWYDIPEDAKENLAKKYAEDPDDDISWYVDKIPMDEIKQYLNLDDLDEGFELDCVCDNDEVYGSDYFGSTPIVY